MAARFCLQGLDTRYALLEKRGHGLFQGKRKPLRFLLPACPGSINFE